MFRVTGFNERNQVIGTLVTGSNTATFFYSSGDLSTSYDGYSFAHLNDDGVIHGEVNGSPATFIALQPTVLDNGIYPYAANAHGDICGLRDGVTVCVWGGAEKTFDLLFDEYAALSNQGLLVGTFQGKAKFLDATTGEVKDPTDLGSSARAVNSQGQVVGQVEGNGRREAYVYTAGVMTVLPIPGNYVDAAATDINDSGEVVGTLLLNGYTGTTGGITTAVLLDYFYCKDSRCMRVGPTSEDFDSLSRIRINDSGAIVLGNETSLLFYQ